MKKLLLLFIVILSTTFLIKAQEWVYAKQFASTGEVEPVDIKVDGNGDIYTVGNYFEDLTIGGLAPLSNIDDDSNRDIYLCNKCMED